MLKMEKATCFILILCGILSQGICDDENNADTSSDLLIRQKRVVGGVVRRLTSCNFLLNVLKNGSQHCPATLLTADVAISSATCFIHQNTRNMRILSRTIGGEQLHEIVRVVFLDPNFNPAYPTVNNLALIRFAPSIHYQTTDMRPVAIYNGNLAVDTYTSRVISWGNPYETGGRLIPANHFQTFPVILLSFEYCQQTYPHIIGNGNICAIGSNAREYCDTNADSGVPLVKGSQLLGIFVYRCQSCQTRPNVFMSLMDYDIKRWIHQHVPSLNLF